MSEQELDKKLVQDLDIDPDDISEALITQPSLRVYYARLAFEKQALYENLKERVGVMEALLYKKYRKLAIQSNEKPTENMLTAEVTSDKNLRKLKTKMIEARKEAGIAKEIMNAMDHKRDMLVQLAKSKLKELEGSSGMSFRSGQQHNKLTESLEGLKVKNY